MTLPEHTRQPLGPNQERWLKALESGEYKQGRSYLRRGDEFCCLGVACEIAGAPIYGTYDNIWRFQNLGAWEECNAPQSIVEHLALRSTLGSSDSGEPALTEMNDGIGDKLSPKPFSEIAAIIRSDPSVYFKEPR